MQEPPQRYTLAPATPATLRQHSRWTCIRPSEPGEEVDWCGVRHTARKYAEKHCADPKRPQGYQPREIHRIERYSDNELSYRGWTTAMITGLLGEYDARAEGTYYSYKDRYYDCDRVHLAESGPAFDQLASEAHNTGQATIYEDDYSGVLAAITTPLDLEMPHTDMAKLLKYAVKDIKRMSREKAKRDGRSRTHRSPEVTDEEAFAHAAARCSWRSHAANRFVHAMRGRNMRGQANSIVHARLSHAALQVLPEFAEVLDWTLEPLKEIPAAGQPLPWTPSVRVGLPEEDLPQKLHNLTNLRWALYNLEPAEAPKTPPWGPVTISAADGSLEPRMARTPTPHLTEEPAR